MERRRRTAGASSCARHLRRRAAAPPCAVCPCPVVIGRRASGRMRSAPWGWARPRTVAVVGSWQRARTARQPVGDPGVVGRIVSRVAFARPFRRATKLGQRTGRVSSIKESRASRKFMTWCVTPWSVTGDSGMTKGGGCRAALPLAVLFCRGDL